MGLTNDGRTTAVEFKMISDGCAYGMSTEGVMRKAAILSCGPYAIEGKWSWAGGGSLGIHDYLEARFV